MPRVKWFPPEKEPLNDALVITNDGAKIWRSWYSAAPGNWYCWCRDYGVKKWRKLFKKTKGCKILENSSSRCYCSFKEKGEEK